MLSTMKPYPEDTITAPATGPGEYGIGILRISGPEALKALARHVERSVPAHDWQPRRLYHGFFRDAQGAHVDEIMAVFFPGPHSFTGEDCAELHCHGGRVVMRRILDELVSSGLRLAQPGEFTRRAFLNGRIDLSRAEAVADLIHARSEASRRIAMTQLEGGLFRMISGLRERAVDLLALVEAYIDFPEEEIGGLDAVRIAADAELLRGEFRRLIDGYEQGRILRDGASILILGRPNVGKSSLLNLLVGEQRAIVSDIPGTTRDTIEETITVAGLPFRIIDSAGIREHADALEAQGIARALAKLPAADLVLLVYDGSQGFLEEDQAVLQQCGDKPLLLIRNKADLPQSAENPVVAQFPGLSLSCHSHAGLDELPLRIEKLLIGSLESGLSSRALICDLRHKEALVRALQALDAFVRLAQEHAPLELLACDLHEVLQALGEITGETTPEEILDRIFERFCIGK